MRKVVIALTFIHILAFMPTVASAAVKVTIQVINSAGTVVVTRGPGQPQAGFNFSAPTSPASLTTSGTTALNILSGSSVRFFPSGGITAATSDLFKLENATTSSLFRCQKTDPQQTSTVPNPAQLLEVKGLKATATLAGQTMRLRVICESEPNDYRTLSSTSGVYPAKAALKGEARKSTSITDPSNVMASCTPLGTFTLINPCLRMSLTINSVPVNGQGLNTVVSTTIPCSNSFDTNGDGKVGDTPCGPNGTGTWNPAALLGDQFNTSDQGSVSCGTTCAPVFRVVITAGPFLNNEFVKLTNSASAGLADGGVEDPLGRENLEVALASEVGTNTWTGYCGNVVSTKVIPQPPLTQGTRNSTAANIPLKYARAVADLVPASQFTMESVGHGDEMLPPDARNSDDACYSVHIPPPGGKLKAVTDLTLTYNFITTPQVSSYPTLATAAPLNYALCSDACFKAYISLQDSKGVFKGRLIVRIGDTTSGINLVADPEERVDASQMAGNLANTSLMTFAEAQTGALGNLLVRAVVVVLDQGSQEEAPPLNHRLVLHDAVFNGSSASGSLFVADSYVPSCDWPQLGSLKIVIYKVTGTLRVLVQTITNVSVDSECFLRGDATVNALQPDPGGSSYEVWVQQDGGVSLPDVGRMTIFRAE
jgi:hypothetical protein